MIDLVPSVFVHVDVLIEGIRAAVLVEGNRAGEGLVDIPPVNQVRALRPDIRHAHAGLKLQFALHRKVPLLDLRIAQVKSKRLDHHRARRPRLQERPRKGKHRGVVQNVVREAFRNPERPAVLARENVGSEIVHVDPIAATHHSRPQRSGTPGKTHARLEIIAVVAAQRASRDASLVRGDESDLRRKSRTYVILEDIGRGNHQGSRARIEVENRVVFVLRRLVVFVAQSIIQRQARREFEIVLDEPGHRPVARVLSRSRRGALCGLRQPDQEIGIAEPSEPVREAVSAELRVDEIVRLLRAKLKSGLERVAAPQVGDLVDKLV